MIYITDRLRAATIENILADSDQISYENLKKQKIDLKTFLNGVESDYLTKADAEKKYMPLGATNTGSSDSSLSISSNGAFNNYANNGQAFNAIRNLQDVNGNKWQGNTGSSFPLNAASFGVKDNGTTAFSHKKYSTFDMNTGKYTGARNTAVLVFSGNSGLLYAKNTGTAADVTDDMYKRIGVIDSPDDNQKVYSSAQIDAITSTTTDVSGRASDNIDLQINSLKARIEDLENQNADLYAKVNLLIQKCGVTEEELGDLVVGGGDARGRGMMPQFDEIEMLQEEKRQMYESLNESIEKAIKDVTFDYSQLKVDEETYIFDEP